LVFFAVFAESGLSDETADTVTEKEQYCGGVGTEPNPLIQKAIAESIIAAHKTPYNPPPKAPQIFRSP
jgi:hypothetical protein